MKKLLSIVLALVLVFSMSACGGQAQQTPSNENGGQTDVTPNSNTQQTPAVNETEGQSSSGYDNFKAILKGKTFTDVKGSEKDSRYHLVKDNETGTHWRYITINANKKGETVNILQLTDLHIVNVNAEDLKNPAIKEIFEKQSNGKNGKGTENLATLKAYSSMFDFTVSTGDILDYLHIGGLQYLQDNLFNWPNSMAVLGNHDISRTNLGVGYDPSTLESRYEILKGYWPNETDYTSKIIKDTVMVIQLDNSQGKYYGSQPKKLAADIQKAREQKLTVLIFQHIPLAVNDAEQSRVNAIYDVGGIGYLNFYKSYIGGSKYVADAASSEVYNLIINNADVIKGVFCGHEHAEYYTEIHGYYTENGKKTDAIIPQIILSNNYTEKGCGVAITVK